MVTRLFMILFFSSLVAACSPLRALNALIPDEGFVVTEDVPYGDDPRQKLDVYRPRLPAGADAPPRGRPVVVFFYGGSWNRGERKDYKFVAEALTSQGMVAVLADYRLYPQVSYPDFLTDSARAVAWARREAAKYGGDPGRLFVMGHSAGAYNAAMLALDPRWLAAEGMAPSQLAGWIGLAGPYDFLPSNVADVRPVFHHPDYPKGAQPIEYASKGTSPKAFLGAALSDSIVNPERNTRQLGAALQSAGGPVTVKLYERVNHITLAGAFAKPLRRLAPVLEDVSAFVYSVNRKDSSSAPGRRELAVERSP